jgi:hypothetical protein
MKTVQRIALANISFYFLSLVLIETGWHELCRLLTARR